MMNRKTADDLRGTTDYTYSLCKILGQRVRDVEVCTTGEFGDVCLSVHKIIMEDGRELFLEGEHDIAFITSCWLPESSSRLIEDLDKLDNPEYYQDDQDEE